MANLTAGSESSASRGDTATSGLAVFDDMMATRLKDLPENRAAPVPTTHLEG